MTERVILALPAHVAQPGVEVIPVAIDFGCVGTPSRAAVTSPAGGAVGASMAGTASSAGLGMAITEGIGSAFVGDIVANEVIDAREEFAAEYCIPAVRANAIDLDSDALASALIAKHLVAAARRHRATTIAYAGSDPSSLAASIRALAPDLKLLLDRQPVACVNGDWALEGDAVVVTFDQGVPVAIDGETVTPLQAIAELHRRLTVPGAAALAIAHRALENATLEGDVALFKRTVDQRWAELVHTGQWFSPLREALDAFITETQQHVSGEVRLALRAGRAVVTGCAPESALYDFDLPAYAVAV